jgi:protease secretion system membrane fusion protein
MLLNKLNKKTVNKSDLNLDQEVLQTNLDSNSIAKSGLWIIGISFGGFLLWASMAPLDEGVPTQGMVSLDTKRKTVQHVSGGILKDVLIQEGQFVKEGQVVLRLDGAPAKVNYESVRQRYLGLRAIQSRLIAEQSGANTIDFHPDVDLALSDPLIKQQTITQQQLFHARKNALAADLQALEENMQGVTGQLNAMKMVIPQRKSQLNSLLEELNNTKELVKEGYVARNRQLELERMVAEANASIAELSGNILKLTRQIAEIGQRSISRKQEYRKEIETLLAEVTREVQSDVEKYKAVTADLDRIEIKAPVTGQVVGLAVQTVGAVVQPGQRLLDVVPENQQLLLEARIPPHLIDKVKPNLKADVRFSSFAHSPQLVVEGIIISVSGDLLTDPQNPQSNYYLARVQLTNQGLESLGKRQMQPGMPAEIVIKTGERSLLTYLLHPLTKRIAASLKEE